MSTSGPLPVSIRETLAGKHILLTGASGFVGKVWLAMVLHNIPQVGRIYILLRERRLRLARAATLGPNLDT